MHHCDYFEYWGHGTEVTVSSETASPTLFPLVQCGPDNAGTITVGCLARDFSPKSLTFQWTNAKGIILTSVQYPATEKNNKYTGVSLLQVPTSDWNSRMSFNCAVTHHGGPKSVKLEKNGSRTKVTVHILPEEDISKEPEVTLVCLVSSPVLQDYYIAWLEQGGQNHSIYSDGVNFPPRKTKHGCSVTSVYTTPKEKWNKNNTFSCNAWPAGSKSPMESRTVSNAQSSSTEYCIPDTKLPFAMSCRDDAMEEDEYSSLWSTTSSFIFLFISSLLYCMIFSLVKMKRP